MTQRYKHYSDDEKKRLIIECRQSGLSDYQWCRQNGINNSTFYYWIKKLRDMACQEALIEAIPRHQVKPDRHEVVRVNILSKDAPTSIVYPSKLTTDTETASIELNLNGYTIKIHNNADPVLLTHTINLLRGVL
ncbi:MAG TPA: transposase [Lachnospiraceae bacterium]|nr:transposase [Lachnospiraceae bacterium]